MIKEILKQLDQEKKEVLLYALEQEITQIVDLGDQTFIAVNLNINNPKYIVIETSGLWVYGRYNRD